jgi:hypothetical protein
MKLFSVLGLNLPSDLQSSQGLPYPKVRSILSLNNPQNSEMKFCAKYEVDMLEIIIIITGNYHKLHFE